MTDDFTMSTPCSDYEPLMAEALFGELPPDERQRLDRHLDDCAACTKEFLTMQATLQLTAQRERPEPPPSFWHGYWPRLVRRMGQEVGRRSAPIERLATWWRVLTEGAPALRWVLQGAVAVVLVLGGFWLGRQPSNASSEELLFGAEEPASTLADLLPASQSAQAERAAAPMLANIEDITYDLSDGTVEIRYNTMSDIIVRGQPDDPAVQQLLRAAMLSEQNPSARLSALQAVEKTRPRANDDLVASLTYLAQAERDLGMRLRAVRALRALQQETGAALRGNARDVLINILLSDADSALRIEALQALMDKAHTDGTAPPFLYEVQNDSNSYVRYRAQQALQEIDATSLPFNTFN